MFKTIRFFAIPVLVIALLGCSSVSVKTDYDTSADFSKYKTYKWGSADDPNDALLKNQLVLKRVYEAIDKSLKSKGFTKVESNPDFAVYPHAGTKEKTDVESWGYGYGGWWGGGPYTGWGGGNIDVTQYTEGTLYIDMVEMSKKQLIWRGVGEGVVGSPSSPEESTEKIDDAVVKILEDYPPQPKK